ncbi:3-hydroxyacyl-CoA dehydrogenase NAD-binding domain-containing protein [Asticcacaulis sp. 201]|uniref:3-hydroxyacyl-CoA dehydrogenase NAD-binding domain-containing protein n=1 Tax=Asticcacaulis sp. 201 TaxID=3028787 RepID=UPI002916B154|nr:3-hydroxyacyl-CoA dehydrogenase NAD-binding domain-containing protein [Asticcacaulis sp. 201]MDV6330964.1 3-hydroxyacyl-CoA dehydrogenase NAD-binding domain-containing protein [Asticcacaulis sp. 201]
MTEGLFRQKIAIIGCGLIGESWAALMTAHGHDVVAWDPSTTVLAGFEQRVENARKQVWQLMPTGRPDTGCLALTDQLETALVGATWVQENAPEKLELKQTLYAQIEAAIDDYVIIASSTSSLTWSELSVGMKRPQRLITAHPFNPPHLMPLVEIYAADAAIRALSLAFYTGLGRQPVVLKRDAVGHIANRLASALWREAVNIVAEDIADVSAVDAALVHGPGLRWSVIGAHMAYHLGGGDGGIEAYLKHLGPSQERRWVMLGSPKLTPDVCKKLIDGIADEAGGRNIEALAAERDAALIRILQVNLS